MTEQFCSQQPNPFIRGYENLTITRIALAYLRSDTYKIPVYLQLSSSLKLLFDDELLEKQGIYGWLDCIDLSRPGELTFLFHYNLQNILYRITGQQNGYQVHIGDVFSQAEAENVVQNLSFKSGVYSRCWEISTSHLEKDGDDYLWKCSKDENKSFGLYFTSAILSKDYGTLLVCLSHTPWTDENLRFEGISSKSLYRGQIQAGMPESLVRLLHLAANSDTRFICFDRDADVLCGLPKFSD